MSQHIIIGTTAPSVIPTKLGQHYIDTVNGSVYVSAGTSSISDWKISNVLTNEQIQDAIGNMFIGINGISCSYNDSANQVEITLNQTSIDHVNLLNKGTNTHAQIDLHIANTSNPHNTTASQVGADPVGTAASSMSAHLLAIDPHSQYATDTALTSGLATKEDTGVAASLLLSHESALDPHPTYLKQIESDLLYATISHIGSGGTEHANATASTSGFMSSADKVKLDGLTSDVVLKSTTTLTSSSNTILSNISELAINVQAGKTYIFEALLRFQTAATTTGISLAIGGTSTGEVTANVNTLLGTGTAGLFTGPLTSLSTSIITSTSVPVANTKYLARITGIFVATTSGQIYPQFRSEVNGSLVTIHPSSTMVFKEI